MFTSTFSFRVLIVPSRWLQLYRFAVYDDSVNSCFVLASYFTPPWLFVAAVYFLMEMLVSAPHLYKLFVTGTVDM